MIDDSNLIEEWRPVVGFEGIYEVSNRGVIRRVGKAHKSGNGQGGGARIGRILKQQPLKGGYRVVFLWREGKQKTMLVHVAVANAFIGECPDGMEVNHKRGSEEGDCIDNLEYMTHQQNCQHAYDTGLRTPAIVPKGIDHHNSKTTPEIVLLIRSRYVRQSRTNGMCALAKEYGLNHKTVWSIIKRKTWDHVK